MKAGEGKKVAQRWVEKEKDALPGLLGAYLSGSILTADENARWPESSDIDVVLVFSSGACPAKLGKFSAESALLEITFMDESEFSSLSHVLSTHYLAFALAKGHILYDPTGFLTKLHAKVAEQYREEAWVRARCESFYERIAKGAENFDVSASLGTQVNSWVFPIGITCFPILAAALKNCTVRKRYTAAREALIEYGMEDFYPRLTELLAPVPITRDRWLYHMAELEKTFSLACESRGESKSLPFRSDISPAGKAIAIEGTRTLLESDHPQEGIFWLTVTFARCHIILETDCPQIAKTREPALLALLADLGVATPEERRDRLRQAVEFLPRLKGAAEKIIAARQFL